jgi:hypothetical protein
MKFNVIDLLLVLVVLLSALHGWRRGFICGSFDLLRWIVSLLAGLRFYQPPARWLGAHVNLWSDAWDKPIAFLLIAIIAGTAVHFLGYTILRRLPKDLHKRQLNRLFGRALPRWRPTRNSPKSRDGIRRICLGEAISSMSRLKIAALLTAFAKLMFVFSPLERISRWLHPCRSRTRA